MGDGSPRMLTQPHTRLGQWQSMQYHTPVRRGRQNKPHDESGVAQTSPVPLLVSKIDVTSVGQIDIALSA